MTDEQRIPMDARRGTLIVPARDPYLQELLQEQFRLEKLQAVRAFLLTVLAIHGAIVWCAAIWPHAVRARGGALALVLWPVCFLGFLLVCILEQRGQARLKSISRESGTQARLSH